MAAKYLPANSRSEWSEDNYCTLLIYFTLSYKLIVIGFGPPASPSEALAGAAGGRKNTNVRNTGLIFS
jgi:hypothetical protein